MREAGCGGCGPPCSGSGSGPTSLLLGTGLPGLFVARRRGRRARPRPRSGHRVARTWSTCDAAVESSSSMSASSLVRTADITLSRTL
ncbi:VPDSG-CTERM sorting domain-containing protein [Streptomyces sp. NPDC052015]|uniref:VPDSG-CTERM sorting domain-containing protein n=1 Tax=Streptomyces sp. NPDC052015 TaxID=3154755 RepID=UPI00342E6FAF